MPDKNEILWLRNTIAYWWPNDSFNTIRTLNVMHTYKSCLISDSSLLRYHGLHKINKKLHIFTSLFWTSIDGLTFSMTIQQWFVTKLNLGLSVGEETKNISQIVSLVWMGQNKRSKAKQLIKQWSNHTRCGQKLGTWNGTLPNVKWSVLLWLFTCL